MNIDIPEKDIVLLIQIKASNIEWVTKGDSIIHGSAAEAVRAKIMPSLHSIKDLIDRLEDRLNDLGRGTKTHESEQ